MGRVCRQIALSTTFAACTLLASLPAEAQPRDATQQSGPQFDEARQRYQRGVQLFNETNFEAARVEFERAYELAPTYKILYNVGLCYGQLGEYVQALTSLEKYLAQGGKEISEERRNEVAKELAQIRPRIAKATIYTNVKGAELLVDDACSTDAGSGHVQCGPLTDFSRVVLMNPGRRRITIRHGSYFPETKVITVAGSDHAEIHINLKPLPKEGAIAEKKSNPYLLPMWIGIGVTGAGLITAGVTGFLATNARDDQRDAVGAFPADRQALDRAQDKTQTLAFVTDAFLIGSAVTGAASTYLLIRALGWKGEPSSTNVKVGLGSLNVSGRF